MLPFPENQAFRKRALPLSIEAWQGLIAANLAPKRSELIHGVVIQKRSKSFLHTKLSAALLEILQQSLRPEWWVRKEYPLTFSNSEPEPDLSVVAGRRDDYQAHPKTAALVVEIAVSSVAEDREMASLYASAGVTEFWIVNANARVVEVYRQPSMAGYNQMRKFSSPETLRCESLPGVTVDLEALFGY